MNRSLKPKVLIALIVAAGLLATVRYFPPQTLLKSALFRIEGLGPLAPVIFIALYVAAAILFVPGAILTISAGVLFGLVFGTIYVSVGATLGATAAFLIGRYLVRDWVTQKLEGNKNFAAIDRAVARSGWKIVGLTRLSPIFPFNLLNYAFGLTNVTLRDYFIASWAGMIPGIVMYVYIGTVVGDLAKVGTAAVPATTAKWTFEIVGLIATIAVAFYITLLARKAMREQIARKDNDSDNIEAGSINRS
jgi:uncharacterized membrane protein YdjX (TVP38/TMEM64 family)